MQPKSTANAPQTGSQAVEEIVLDLNRCAITAQDLNQIPIRVELNPVSTDLAVKHLRAIAKHVHSWYRYIPPNVRAFYEPADMVNDVALHVHSMMMRYQPEKAREITWVYRVAHNSCRDIVQRYQRQMRNAVTVEIDEPTSTLSQASFLSKRESINAVERVIAISSDAAQDLIECLLSGDYHRKADLPRYTRNAIEELREKARIQNATVDDFLTVFRHATA